MQEGPWIARRPARRAPPPHPRRPRAGGRAWWTSARSRRRPAAPSPRPRSRSSAETMSLVIDGGGSKGDVLTVAELAGRHGRQADRRADPAVPPDRAHGPRRDDHARPRRGRAPDPRRGRDHGPDGRRDGGDDGGVGRRADRLRHGQGRRAGRRDPRPAARVEDRRQERRVAPAAPPADDAAEADGASPATGWRGGSGEAQGRRDAPIALGARADRERPERRGHRARTRRARRWQARLGELGFGVERRVVPDERAAIEAALVAGAAAHRARRHHRRAPA